MLLECRYCCRRKVGLKRAVAIEEQHIDDLRPTADGLVQTLVAASPRRERSLRIQLHEWHTELSRNVRAAVARSRVCINNAQSCVLNGAQRSIQSTALIAADHHRRH